MSNGPASFPSAAASLGTFSSAGIASSIGFLPPLVPSGRICEAAVSTYSCQHITKSQVLSCEYFERGYARAKDIPHHILAPYRRRIICPCCALDEATYTKTVFDINLFKRHISVMHTIDHVMHYNKSLIESLSLLEKSLAKPHSPLRRYPICCRASGTSLQVYEYLKGYAIAKLRR